jgi:ribosomal protein L16 Arg81 hydroxylase
MVSHARRKELSEGLRDAGDLVYIPRGFVHDATSSASVSLHLAVGVNSLTWGAVLLRALDLVIERDSRFRESLPAGFANNDKARQHAEIRLTELLDVLNMELNPPLLVDDAIDAALLGRHPSLEGHLLDLEAASQVTLQTQVHRRPDVQWRLTVKNGLASLYFHGKAVQIPDHTETELRFITETNEFSADELPGDLDGEGKLTLVQRLIREGFLTT